VLQNSILTSLFQSDGGPPERPAFTKGVVVEEMVSFPFWLFLALVTHAAIREWKRKREWRKLNEQMNQEK
jgi:hypothetical protein